VVCLFQTISCARSGQGVRTSFEIPFDDGLQGKNNQTRRPGGRGAWFGWVGCFPDGSLGGDLIPHTHSPMVGTGAAAGLAEAVGVVAAFGGCAEGYGWFFDGGVNGIAFGIYVVVGCGERWGGGKGKYGQYGYKGFNEKIFHIFLI
jgi:hypothetical protein